MILALACLTQAYDVSITSRIHLVIRQGCVSLEARTERPSRACEEPFFLPPMPVSRIRDLSLIRTFSCYRNLGRSSIDGMTVDEALVTSKLGGRDMGERRLRFAFL